MQKVNSAPDYWKVRLAIAGGLIHVASRTQPKVVLDHGRLVQVEMDLLEGPQYGDTIGYIDWTAVKAVTWRQTKTRDDDDNGS